MTSKYLEKKVVITSKTKKYYELSIVDFNLHHS